MRFEKALLLLPLPLSLVVPTGSYPRFLPPPLSLSLFFFKKRKLLQPLKCTSPQLGFPLLGKIRREEVALPFAHPGKPISYLCSFFWGGGVSFTSSVQHLSVVPFPFSWLSSDQWSLPPPRPRQRPPRRPAEHQGHLEQGGGGG